MFLPRRKERDTEREIMMHDDDDLRDVMGEKRETAKSQ